MNRIIQAIPNTVTCCNLFSGCLAVVFALQGNLAAAFWAVTASMAFDFCDGFLARLLKAYSPMGKELDSLADVVSFGVAPSMVMFTLTDSYVAFMIAVFSALRLAKFNIDERQTTGFIGMPTPANAMFFAALGYIVHRSSGGFLFSVAGNTVFQFAAIIIMSLLLVSEIPMFSLKFKTYSLKDNYLIYLFLIASVVSIAVFQVAAIPFTVVAYILISVIKYLIISI